MKTKFEEFIGDADNHRLLEQEALLLGATETISTLMESRNITKAALAKLLGTSKSHITQLLSGNRNMTLITLADILFSLGYKAKLTARPLRESGIAAYRWGGTYRVTTTRNLDADVLWEDSGIAA